MTRPLRKQFPGARYHITARGNGRQRIFRGGEDYHRFLEQLERALELDGVILYAYSCMVNHYHLLIETPRGNVQQFQHRLNTAYSMYYRYRHQHPGHVLQGRYGAKLVNGDRYLVGVTRYIHLNPVKTKRVQALPEGERVKYLRNYQWSSYRGYVQGPFEQEMVNYRWRKLAGGRGIAQERAGYRRYVKAFISEDDEEMDVAMNRSRYAIGDQEFVETVEGEMLADVKEGERSKDVIWPDEARAELDLVDKEVARVYKVRVDQLREHGRKSGEAKRVAIELSCRLSGKPQVAVGEHYGSIGCAAVAYQRRSLRDAMTEDSQLSARLRKIERRILRKL